MSDIPHWWKESVLHDSMPIPNTNLLLAQDLRNDNDNFHVVKILDNTTFAELGFFTYNQYHARDLPFPIAPGAVYLIVLELNVEHRGKGLGTLIASGIEGFFKSKHKKEIWIISTKERVNFWSRLGFKGTETLHDGLFMKKII